MFAGRLQDIVADTMLVHELRQGELEVGVHLEPSLVVRDKVIAAPTPVTHRPARLW
jgi:hypothetical protein